MLDKGYTTCYDGYSTLNKATGNTTNHNVQGGSMLLEHKYAKLFPPMGAEEYEALKASIKEEGLNEPIALYKGKILDGRNRYRAIRELGIELGEDDTIQLPYNTEPLKYVMRVNLHRRQISTSQRAMVAIGIANLRPGQSADDGATQDDVSRMYGVSLRSIRQAARVKRDGIEEIGWLVFNGDVSVSDAESIVGEEQDIQQEALKVWQAAEGEVTLRKALKTVQDAIAKANREEEVVQTTAAPEQQEEETNEEVVVETTPTPEPQEEVEQPELDIEPPMVASDGPRPVYDNEDDEEFEGVNNIVDEDEEPSEDYRTGYQDGFDIGNDEGYRDGRRDVIAKLRELGFEDAANAVDEATDPI